MKKTVKKLICLMAAFALFFSLSVVTDLGVRTAEASTRYHVRVESGYLALRTAKAYDSRNEIGRLYTGDAFDVTDASDYQYWYGYSPKLGMYGYVNKDYLVADSSLIYGVTVAKGYLALRTAKAYDSRNEIGKLYNGDRVEVQDTADSQYWYVYAPSLGKYGYVNKDYLYYISGANNSPAPAAAPSSGRATYRVSVASGYLALRSAMAYDPSNEIGRLYSGDTVELQEKTGSQYWYVYSPSLGRSGYVNKDYLIYVSGGSSVDGASYQVRVSSGYLALRSAMAYDPSNEIGRLYTGETVRLQERTGSQYWYVYAPSLGKYGYVNKDYLVGPNGNSSSGNTRTVSVSEGYLALRSAKAYDPSNEIGKLYSGYTVQLQDTSDSQYWYVYAPALDKYGYVNKDYLY